jgi:hypothetical protein
MNTSTVLFASPLSFLASLRGNLQALVKLNFAPPASAAPPARPPMTVAPCATLTASEPDIWQLYRLAVTTDSVHPSLAAEIAKFQQNDVAGG